MKTVKAKVTLTYKPANKEKLSPFSRTVTKRKWNLENCTGEGASEENFNKASPMQL